MSNRQLSGPASASGIDWKDLNGALLLIEVKSLEHGIKTTFGVKDAVRADIVVLDGPKAGEAIDDTLVFPTVLQGQIKPKLGGLVLGRLGQGIAKPGQEPPWMLGEPTDADRALGLAHLDKAKAAPPF